MSTPALPPGFVLQNSTPALPPGFVMQPEAPPKVEAEASWADRGREALQGAKASLDKSALGIKGLLPQSVQDAGDWLDQKLGSGGLTAKTAVKAPDTWAGTAGNIAGDVATYAPLAMVPGGLPTMMGVNAAASAAMTPGDIGERAKAGGLAAGGAAVGAGLSRALGRLAKPIGDKAADTAALEARGVRPTFGQGMAAKEGALPRAIGRAEEGAMSVPIASGPLRNSRRAATDQWRQAVRNEASAPGRTGAATMDDVRSGFNDAYTTALDSVPLPYASVQYTPDLRRLSAGRPISQDQRAMVAQVFDDIRLKHMQNPTPGAQVTAAGAHGAESELKALGRRYGASPDPAQQDLGHLFDSVARDYGSAWRGALPTDLRQEVAAIDRAYPGFTAARTAAKNAAAAASDAVPDNFSPAVLTRAARTADRTPNKTTYIRGEAPLQEMARLGQGLQGKVPDSGTTERLIGTGILGGSALLGQLPAALAGGAGLAAYGTAPVQNYLMGRAAPGVQQMLLELMRSGAPLAGAAGAGAAQQFME